jgi:uncharacterized repeat protein (TIGR03803 family)
VYAFTGGSDGQSPAAGLINLNGTLYGTTYLGGGGNCAIEGRAHGCGTVYSVTTGGSEKVLYAFANEPDGEFPDARLLAVNGALYGTTILGGPDSQGIAFRVTLAGAKTILHGFGAGTDGRNPEAGLIYAKGTFYGTTASGGYASACFNGCGTVFSMTPRGAVKILHNFADNSDGKDPESAVSNVTGTLYGTTFEGGTNSAGTVYSLTTRGEERVLYSFGGGTDGSYPRAALTKVGSTLYGTTANGGAGFGTVYSFSP